MSGGGGAVRPGDRAARPERAGSIPLAPGPQGGIRGRLDVGKQVAPVDDPKPQSHSVAPRAVRKRRVAHVDEPTGRVVMGAPHVEQRAAVLVQHVVVPRRVLVIRQLGPGRNGPRVLADLRGALRHRVVVDPAPAAPAIPGPPPVHPHGVTAPALPPHPEIHSGPVLKVPADPRLAGFPGGPRATENAGCTPSHGRFLVPAAQAENAVCCTPSSSLPAHRRAGWFRHPEAAIDNPVTGFQAAFFRSIGDWSAIGGPPGPWAASAAGSGMPRVQQNGRALCERKHTAVVQVDPVADDADHRARAVVEIVVNAIADLHAACYCRCLHERGQGPQKGYTHDPTVRQKCVARGAASSRRPPDPSRPARPCRTAAHHAELSPGPGADRPGPTSKTPSQRFLYHVRQGVTRTSSSHSGH